MPLLESTGERSGRAALALDVEQQEPLVRPRANTPWNRSNIAVLTCMGALLVFLVVMASVFTGRGGGSGGGGDGGGGGGGGRSRLAFEVPRGALAGCADSEPLCLIRHPTPAPGWDYRGHPRQVVGSRGVVAADQSRCSDIGARVLEEGGHAVDAAVAAALCQGVVNPFASGAGGGHIALIRSANGSAEAINAREVAPGGASRDMFEGRGPYASLDGGLAVALPLELRGLELAWRRHGRLAWARLVGPAAEVAAHGFAAHPYLVYVMTGSFTLRRLKSDPLTREAFLLPDPRVEGGWRAPRVGELCCRRPALAATLNAVARHGVQWLYAPERAEAMAAEIRAAGGLVQARDFQVAQPRVEPVLSYTLPGGPGAGSAPLTLLVPPPPSSGAVLALALAIVAGYGDSGRVGPQLAAHRMVEAMKHAFAVRSALGDPGTPAAPFADVAPVLADVANGSWVDMLRARINDSAVLPLSQYGGRWNPEVVGTAPTDHGTSHLAVVDAEGNAVSLTTTVNTAFGSNVMSKSTGILFNNEMDDFSQPGRSNTYKLAPAEANFIAPYKRPLSSMSPAMLLGPGGRLRLVLGASNGPRIVSGVLQTVLRVLYEGVDPLAAVSAPRLHHQLLPDRCLFENFSGNGVPFNEDPGLVAYLAGKGNSMVPEDAQLGDVQAILLQPAPGSVAPEPGGGGGGGGFAYLATAVSDPRKDGAPAAATR